MPNADFAGALRLQNQRTFHIFVSGADIARATRKNGMLPLLPSFQQLLRLRRLSLIAGFII
jgi:hypothetical protein